MSDAFSDRQKGFERKFQLDGEQQFRAQARRDRLFGRAEGCLQGPQFRHQFCKEGFLGYLEIECIFRRRKITEYKKHINIYLAKYLNRATNNHIHNTLACKIFLLR